ncbi:Zinc/iron permease [Teratosphaeria nubilosa]|uniref:Zinc/iron permease n=1 Tax=Teratosphaeria nubilosa TaxID=161662 RepID=A0A6G1KTF1_9PEZI|nr:Zinc/iron permease [Teratosphaeria nubilosa]
MADGLLTLLVLCVVMASASFLAGLLPLSFSLTPRQLRLITALGTGVLVGTSLVVIIPEGIEALYDAGATSATPPARPLTRRWTLSDISAPSPPGPRDALDAEKHLDFITGPDDGFDRETATGAPPADSPHHHPAGADSVYDPHVWVGISLISGFILMYLVDTLPQHATPRTEPRRFSISLTSLSSSLHFASTAASQPPNGHISHPVPAAADDDAYPPTSASHPSARPSSTTVGLVIHAAADGIALGASSTSPTDLTLIIFLALMLHKAPAAFGLTSVLLKQGLSKRAVRTHLIIFSLAAPVGALLTYSAAHLLGYRSEYLGTQFTTGVLLLFSGGTFLYVAMHTMQEAGAAHGAGHGWAEGDGYAGVGADEGSYSGGAKAEGRRHLIDTLVTVGGMLVPLLTQWGHGH